MPTTVGQDVLAEASGVSSADGSGVLLSVCIPCYSTPASMVQQSLDSAASQLPPRAEILLLPSGQQAVEAVGTLTLPGGARVVASIAPLDIVSNWNRCLEAASGVLVHILHADDVVARGFYRVVSEMATRFPDAAMYATAATTNVPLTAAPPSEEELLAQPELLDGIDAARFLLTDRRHVCGNVVLTRRALEAKGGFLPRFGYCCDEEAYLRIASAGGIGFHPAPLYRERVHDGQDRYRSWLRPEFVPTYVGARLEGADAIGSDARALAERSSVQRVVSIAVTLASAGLRAESVQQLDRLEAFMGTRRFRRIAVAKVICRSRAALAVLRLRRRVIARRRR